MERKSIFLSKTFWVGVIAIVAGVVQIVTGDVWLDDGKQVMILGVVAVILRKITNKPVAWK